MYFVASIFAFGTLVNSFVHWNDLNISQVGDFPEQDPFEEEEIWVSKKKAFMFHSWLISN